MVALRNRARVDVRNGAPYRFESSPLKDRANASQDLFLQHLSTAVRVREAVYTGRVRLVSREAGQPTITFGEETRLCSNACTRRSTRQVRSLRAAGRCR